MMLSNSVVFAIVVWLALFVLLDISRGWRFRGKRLLHPILALNMQVAISVMVMGSILYWLSVMGTTLGTLTAPTTQNTKLNTNPAVPSLSGRL
jgi:hypothetical protein